MSKRNRYRAIEIEDFPLGERSNFWRDLYQDAAGSMVQVPFIVARGELPGPVLGITAAVHGNELNGISIIHHLLDELDLSGLSGTLVCCPIVNVPAYNQGVRCFPDGLDLNHVFPGKRGGKPAEQYAHAFVSTMLPCLDYLVDIHTASEGRLNTLYVRVDFADEVALKMATEFNAHILLHGRGGDGTFRTAARRRKVPAITVEAGNPSVIQGRMVYDGEIGVRNVMKGLGMLEGSVQTKRHPVLCRRSTWLRTRSGGLLETHFKLYQLVTKKQLLATVRDPFGQLVAEYYAPWDGVVIGKAANPAAEAGTRFCHLGAVQELSEILSDPELRATTV